MLSSPLRSRSRLTLYLAGAFLLFLAFMAALSAITYKVVSNMVTTATEIDDKRASRAAEMALTSLKESIASVATDNAAWTEGYEALRKPDASNWVWYNWGYITGNNWLSDGVVIIGEHGEIRDAYEWAKPFDPLQAFGPTLRKSAELAIAKRNEPVSGFLRDGDHIAVMGVQLVRPNTVEDRVDDKNVLVLFRELTPEYLSKAMRQFNLPDMKLVDKPIPGDLSQPITGMDGDVIGYLCWKSEEPGAILYARQKPMIAAGILVLIGFVGIAILSAWLEWRRLGNHAATSFHMATHDGLTDLLNRSGFFHALESRHASTPVTLFLMDLDGFKAVNDTWGHPVGDKLIRRVADAMRNCHPDIRYAARFGGDEFAVATDRPESVPAMIEALLGCFRAPFMIDEHVIEVGVSIGIASDAGGITVTEQLRRADLALYNAKDAGKGRAAVFTAELDAAKTREAKLELELRAALRAGDVFPVFQPLFDAKTHAITGVEALARWAHPSETVPPDVFIALAEKCGLIDALGAWLIEESIRHASRWPALSLSVNISPLQLCNPGFAAQVETILAATGFDPARLTLEVTEGVLISNPEQARRSILALKKIGVTFALDDFGSGYASIGVLRQFGFDRIKIDRSLVAAAEVDHGGLEVMKATVQLARALDLPVTAEGIENVNQARLLSEAGCDQLQGFLLGRPMSAAKMDQRQKDGEDQARSASVA